VINAIRAHLAEFEIVAPVGRESVEDLLRVIGDPKGERVPNAARACLAALGAQLRVLKAQVLEFDRMINAWHRSHKSKQRSTRFQASVPRWPPPWSPVWLIQGFSGRAVISRPGSGWCRSSTPAGARKSSAVSASRGIVICEACL
jgi:hypothetical protein